MIHFLAFQNTFRTPFLSFVYQRNLFNLSFNPTNYKISTDPFLVKSFLHLSRQVLKHFYLIFQISLFLSITKFTPLQHWARSC
jgi:hypothetical protein